MNEDKVQDSLDRCILMCRAEALALDLYAELGEILCYKILNLIGEEGNLEINSLQLLVDTLHLHKKEEHERIAQLYNKITDVIIDYSQRLNKSIKRN